VITFTDAQLNAWMAMLIWPFVRILAILSTDPVFGNRVIPFRVKAGLALFLTLLIAPTLPALPQVEPGSAAGLLILMQQIIIGIAMGLAMRVVFVAVEMSGHLIGLQMGLGFATFFDPIRAAQVPVLAQLIGLFAILIYLSVDGHLMTVAALSESFSALPIMAGPLAVAGWRELASWGSEVFSAGLLLSLPVLAALLITNLSLGIMTRAAPQLNLFAVGFAITLIAGFAVLYLSIPYFAPVVERMFYDGMTTALQVLRHAKPTFP
jgi:flagellar biosynthetic protein FliR